MNNSPFPTFSTSSIVINHGNYRNGNYTTAITTIDPILTIHSFLKSQKSSIFYRNIFGISDFFPSTNPLNSLRLAPESICDRFFVCQETAPLLVSTATRTFDLRDVLMGKTLRNFRISHEIPIMSHQILSMMTYGWLVVPGTMEF